ncbi:MAG TPA: Crp/Fnr family transcriptional regulator [Sphingomicrobium sp.]|nr:Crp/Fnr family transcriptional regulator [Sphingomicrobium sp.]
MIEAHLKKLRARDSISAEEERAVRALVANVIETPQDKTLVRHGERLGQSMILLSGWLARTKDLPSGHRQIAELHVAGDFADLHGFSLKYLDHDVISITRSRVALVPHERLKDLTERFPHLARVYWAMTNIDAAIQREWTLSLGRRTAIARMAHLLCELSVRLGIVGLNEGNSFEFPLTQVEFGECLGLTSVHVNRTLQELRRRELIELQSRRVTIFDLEALKGVAEFDDAYLYLERRRR